MCFPFLYIADLVSLANSLVFSTSYHIYRRTFAGVCALKSVVFIVNGKKKRQFPNVVLN